MADAAARREARRRRILENSHSRLKLISGKCADEFLQEPTISSYTLDQDYTPSLASSSSYEKPSQNNGDLFSESETLQFISALTESSAGGDQEISELLLPSPTPEPSTKTTTLWEKLIANRYDIVLLSLFIQFLYGISVISFDGSYFFLPVIVYIVTKLIYYPLQNNSSIANALLLLNGMSPERIESILYAAQIFSIISCDIFVYLFVTICVQSFWTTLKDLVT